MYLAKKTRCSVPNRKLLESSKQRQGCLAQEQRDRLIKELLFFFFLSEIPVSNICEKEKV